MVAIRLILRLLATIALVAAVATGAVDATRSVAAETVMTTPFGLSWSVVSVSTLAKLHALAVANLPAWGVAAFDWLLAQPAGAVFLVAALLFYCLGYRRRPRSRRYALS